MSVLQLKVPVGISGWSEVSSKCPEERKYCQIWYLLKSFHTVGGICMKCYISKFAKKAFTVACWNISQATCNNVIYHSLLISLSPLPPLFPHFILKRPTLYSHNKDSNNVTHSFQKRVKLSFQRSFKYYYHLNIVTLNLPLVHWQQPLQPLSSFPVQRGG